MLWLTCRHVESRLTTLTSKANACQRFAQRARRVMVEPCATRGHRPGATVARKDRPPQEQRLWRATLASAGRRRRKDSVEVCCYDKMHSIGRIRHCSSISISNRHCKSRTMIHAWKRVSRAVLASAGRGKEKGLSRGETHFWCV